MERNAAVYLLVLCWAGVAMVARGKTVRRYDSSNTCDVNGVSYQPMEFVDMGNPCDMCVCSEVTSLPECVTITCPVAPCVDPTRVPGMCCPICLNGKFSFMFARVSI